jgi:hypothetical protein
MTAKCTNFPHCLDEPCSPGCDQAGIEIRHELAQEAMRQAEMMFEEEADQ